MPPIKLGVIGGTGRLYAGPTLVGLGRGYFAAQDLDITISEVVGRSGLELLAKDELDVTPLGPGFYFFSLWNPERPMVLVADQGRQAPGRGSGAIVARPELLASGTLKDYSDLRGKRLGLSPDRGDHDWLTFASALRRGNLTFDDVEVVITDFGDARHKALEHGDIDASTVGRLSSIIEGRDAGAFVVWKHEYEVQPGRQQFAVMFSYRLWSERPDEARRYVRAYLQGAREYHRAFEEGIDRDAVVDVLAEQSGYPREAVAKDMVPTALDPNGFVNVEAIATDLKWLQDEGLLPETISLDRAINHTFVEAALSELGRYEPLAAQEGKR
jgi:NitT/TauT family transport system substrate-binding protein